MEIKVSESNIALPDLVTKIYSEAELNNISQFNGNMYELNNDFPIECIRKINKNYRVSYLGDQTVAIINFDEYGNRVNGRVYSMLLSKSDFSNLTDGCSLNNVRKLDPMGEYLFLFTGRNDSPRYSTHYTYDGYIINIMYDNENKVTNINYDLI